MDNTPTDAADRELEHAFYNALTRRMHEDPITFSSGLLFHHAASGDATVLDSGVELMRSAYMSQPQNISFILHLCVWLRTRHECSSAAADNHEMIFLLRRALNVVPGLEDHPFLLESLGIALQWRFQRTGKFEDLEAAISTIRHILELTPEGDPDKANWLDNLGSALQHRFKAVGELEDLETAISTSRHAVEITPEGHADKPTLLNNLGVALQRRFEHVGELEDLEATISTKRRAVEFTPDGHPDKPTWLSNLGTALQYRFERVHELPDLEAVISAGRHAVELTPEGDPNKPGRLSNLGCALQSRFEHVGELEDLEAAISANRRAVELAPDGHSDKPTWLSNLGTALERRFERVGELQDLIAAISTKRYAVELTPESHADKPGMLSNLGTALQCFFKHLGTLDVLEAAISANYRAVELTLEGDSEMSGRLSNLGAALLRRFERTDKLEDLEAAVSTSRRAVELMPDGHPDKLSRLDNLGSALLTRFERVNKLEDLEAAISTCRRAVELTPIRHPVKPSRLYSLGIALQSRFEQYPTSLSFAEASACFLEGATCSSGSPFDRFQPALGYVKILVHNPQFTTAPSILDAYSHIVCIILELVWLGHNLDRRYEESSRYAPIISNAVSAAIQSGALSRAVEWLETGRSIVWSQLLALRTPLDELEVHHRDLSIELRDVQRQLRHTAHILRSDQPRSVVVGQLSPDAQVILDHHRRLSIKRDGLLKKIRECDGFENFLLPQLFPALLQSRELCHGHFVYIKVHRSHCHALVVLSRDEPKLVDLPGLSFDRAEQLQSLWIEQLRQLGRHARSSHPKTAHVPRTQPSSPAGAQSLRRSAFVQDDDLTSDRLLERLWDWVVGPILEALGLLVQDEMPPHITWCPTGPLTRLPLHAAGRYSEPDGPRAFHYVASSYSPSLSALTRAAEGLAKKPSSSSVLVVTQHATPGQSPLRGTLQESHQLCQLLHKSRMQHDVLNHKQATRDSVLSVMNRHSWVHFACHGSQRKYDPTKSAFYLYESALSLADLMQTVSDDAELAFLSACQTATGDAVNPEEAVHLAAGMLAVGYKGVIATMWSIGDADAPIVVEAYYKRLLESRNTGAVGPGETGAAYALHEAVKVLRDRVGEKNFVSWAPFVHFGV
ncbi:unnamed protein product [Peniophora sp. CBMAI 1063]|nr:unnamed protein product [Peniophora sp. CBMAI 1063]